MSRLGERVSSFRLAELEAGYYIFYNMKEIEITIL